MEMGGSWSTYWYNGVIVSSEIARGLDVLELLPSQHLTQNEIDAAKTVRLASSTRRASRALVAAELRARAGLLDQLERNGCLTASRVTDLRSAIGNAERATGSERQQALQRVAGTLDAEARNACDRNKVRDLQQALQNLAQVTIS
jgi:hypothetical protein